MSNWKPGDVAILTFEKYPDEPGVGVRVRDGEWAHSGRFGSGAAYDEYGGFSARPVVVLDPGNPADVNRLCEAIDQQPLTQRPDPYKFQAALRSLISDLTLDEPTGLGAVVEDSKGRPWIRWSRGTGCVWRCAEVAAFDSRAWGKVAAVRVLSEGVAL